MCQLDGCPSAWLMRQKRLGQGHRHQQAAIGQRQDRDLHLGTRHQTGTIQDALGVLPGGQPGLLQAVMEVDHGTISIAAKVLLS